MISKLEKCAKRIGEISEEIKEAISQREINLTKCRGSEDEIFQAADKESERYNSENCLTRAYTYTKECLEAGDNHSFEDILYNYGCLNCNGAYRAKQKIGQLKQERGRIVGNISKIGKSLGESK